MSDRTSTEEVNSAIGEIAKLKVDLIAQEHRTLEVWRNYLGREHLSPEGKDAATWALIRWLFVPAGGVGVGAIAILGVAFSGLQVCETRLQTREMERGNADAERHRVEEERRAARRDSKELLRQRLADDECAQSEACRTDGRCTAVDGKCYPTLDGCRASLVCKEKGSCAAWSPTPPSVVEEAIGAESAAEGPSPGIADEGFSATPDRESLDGTAVPVSFEYFTAVECAPRGPEDCESADICAVGCEYVADPADRTPPKCIPHVPDESGSGASTAKVP